MNNRTFTNSTPQKSAKLQAKILDIIKQCGKKVDAQYISQELLKLPKGIICHEAQVTELAHDLAEKGQLIEHKHLQDEELSIFIKWLNTWLLWPIAVKTKIKYSWQISSSQ